MAEALARLREYPTSTRKMRYVADLIRGMDVEKALFVLQYSTKQGARPMEKLLRSAIDNWEKHNEGLRTEDAQLFVKTIFVDGGAMLKRWLPAPHGRAFKKRKRSNHITLVVDSKVLMQQEQSQPEVPEVNTETTEPAIAETSNE